MPHGTLFSPPAKNSYDTDAFEKLDEEREEEDQQDRSEVRRAEKHIHSPPTTAS